MAAYDIVGDVHGCADALERLLRQLGYVERDGAWRCAGRQAVFVGDLVDRGTQQVRTVQLVRRMVDAGAALIAMGNHEFNAVAWVTPDESNPGEFLRCHGGSKGQRHRRQHTAFLDQVGEHSPLHHEIIDWFRTLPMHLDLGGIRVVHACWHEDSLAVLRAGVGDEGLSDEFLAAAHHTAAGGSPAYWAIETVLKGPEVDLPVPYVDREGVTRNRARLRWWDTSATTLGRLAEIPPSGQTPDGQPYPDLGDEHIAEAESFRYAGEVPVVFGHYWRRLGDTVCEPLAACVDLSAIRGGHLAAYRFDGEPTLEAGRIVAVAA